MGVEAGGQQDEVGIEPGDHGHDQLAHRAVVVGVPAARLERHVQREAEPVAPSHVAGRARPRIEGVLVERDEQHRGVLVEHPLGAVPVVHVVVDDRDPVEARRPRGRRRHRHAVEQAEAHRPVRLGVMARRPHQGHGRGAVGEGGLDGGDDGAGRQQRHLVRGVRRVGVGVEAQAPPRRVRDAVDVGGPVHPGQLAAGRGSRRRQRAAPLDPPAGHRGHDLATGRPLGMAARRLVLDEPIAADENHG